MVIEYLEDEGIWIAHGLYDSIPVTAEGATRVEAACEWLYLAVEQAKADVAFLQATMKPRLRSV